MPSLMSLDNFGAGGDKIYVHLGISSTITNSFNTPDIASDHPYGLTCDGTNLISCSLDQVEIYVHSGISSTITNSFNAPTSPSGLAYDGTNLISDSYPFNKIYVHSGISSTITTSFAPPDNFVMGLTYTGTNLISSDYWTHKIYVHSGISSTITTSFNAPANNPKALTYDYYNANLISSCYAPADPISRIYVHSGISSTITDSFDAPVKNIVGLAYGPAVLAPVAEFSGIPTSGYAPLAVQFTDLSTNDPTSWLWDFGDGETSTVQNPSHTYDEPGVYAVTLTATNAGGSDSEVKNDYITVLSALPATEFSADPLSGYAPLTVQFTDGSTNDPTSWEWDFGDGETSTEQNPSHTYDEPGIYTVTLTASNAAGSDTNVKTDYITVLAVTIGAEFSAEPREGKYPLAVHFTDLSTGGPAPSSWLWDFGNSTSTEQNPVHVYNRAGSFTVSLRVGNALGTDTETKSNYITATERSALGVRTEDRTRNLNSIRSLITVRNLAAARDPAPPRVLGGAKE